jgi:hypothetical protein
MYLFNGNKEEKKKKAYSIFKKKKYLSVSGVNVLVT